MRKLGRVVLVLGVGLLSFGASASVASAATLPATCSDLQTVLDGANSGDTVDLAPNPQPNPLCTGQNVNLDNGTTRTLTLQGQSGAGFDGTTAATSMVHAIGGSGNITVSNLIFENAPAAPPRNGGALVFQGNYSVTITGDTFTNNEVGSGGSGGALDVETTQAGATVTVTNDTFTGNQSTGMGGRASGGAANIAVSGAGNAITLSGDTFTDNQTAGGGEGGGVEIEALGANPSLAVSNSTFTGNVTNSSGGGLNVFAFSPIPITLTGNVFSANKVDGCGSPCELDGGGVAINNLGAGNAAVTQTGNTLTGNQITNGTGIVEGGGEAVIGETLKSTSDVFTVNAIQAPAAGSVSNGSALALGSNDCSSSLLSNAVNLAVAGNSIADGGAAASAHGAVSTFCETGTVNPGANQLTLTNSTISGNLGGGGTGGLWGENLDQATLQNSIVKGNPDGADLGGFTGGTVTATYTDLCNGSNPFTGTGNICAAPQLANAPNGDVHETTSSPTIDVGSNALVPVGVTTDVYGVSRIQPRFVGGPPIVDMGAAELPSLAVPVPPPSASIAIPMNGAVYAPGQKVLASYTCSDGSGGPGIASCVGTVPNGSPVDTSTTGTHTFTVTATSLDGQTGAASVAYTVALAPPPSVSITSPAKGAVYALGQQVLAAYTCTEGAGGPGISSCVGPVPSGSPIDTSTTGTHTFTVTATSGSGQTGTASVTYTVAAAPSVTIASPLTGARYIRGNSTVLARFSCNEGAGGPGLSSCDGTVPSGTLIDTTTPGLHTFAVTAKSSDGQVTSASVSYRVVFPSNKPVRPPHLRRHSDGRFIVTVKVPHRGRVDILVTAWKDNFAPGFGPAADIGPPKPVLLPAAPGRFVFARAHMTFNAGGTYQIPVIPNAAGRRLVRHHRYPVTLRLWISYTPWGGFPGKLGYFGLHLP